MLELINWRSQTHWYFRLSEKQTFNGPFVNVPYSPVHRESVNNDKQGSLNWQ